MGLKTRQDEGGSRKQRTPSGNGMARVVIGPHKRTAFPPAAADL